MEITEVRVALRDSPEKRLKAYATVTFDHCFVVRTIKIIEGKNGLFVAMPSHKPKVACERCHFKNDLGGRFCTQCGSCLSRPVRPGEGEGRIGLEGVAASGVSESAESHAHRDIAHPITVEFRQYLQQTILTAYEAERAKGSGPSAGSAQAVHETS